MYNISKNNFMSDGGHQLKIYLGFKVYRFINFQ